MSNEITITMPKWQYDQILHEIESLKKELSKGQYKTYINFRTDDKKCKGIDFPGLYQYCKTIDDIPEIIDKLNKKITKIIENVNWVIADKNDKSSKCKAQFIEVENHFNKKKSFWNRIFD